jgi:signal transduction histidine kinase
LLILINDVLDLAHIKSNRVSIAVDRIDPSDAIQETASTVRFMAEKRGVLFNDMTEGLQLPSIEFDPTRLRQALLNLLSNGVKYNSSGGTLTVSVEEADD